MCLKSFVPGVEGLGIALNFSRTVEKNAMLPLEFENTGDANTRLDTGKFRPLGPSHAE
jgi:hypothetical protein